MYRLQRFRVEKDVDDVVIFQSEHFARRPRDERRDERASSAASPAAISGGGSPGADLRDSFKS